jgi:hypothetical protein
MGRLILVLLVLVDILQTTVPAGTLVQEIQRTVIEKDGLHATIWDMPLARFTQGLPVRQVIAKRIVMDMRLVPEIFQS